LNCLQACRRWLQLTAAHIPFVREYRFAAIATGGTGKGLRERLAKAGLKDWRIDFAFPQWKWAVEVEGGAFSQYCDGSSFIPIIRCFSDVSFALRDRNLNKR